MRTINLIVIHCSATRSDRPFPFEALDAYHKSLGWKGCGYHYYITRDGQLHQGRPEEMVGAHAGPRYNPGSIGVCYEGGLTPDGKCADTRTPAQKQTLQPLLRRLTAAYPRVQILGHRDLPSVKKACPCFNAIAEYTDLQPAPPD